MSTFKDAIVAKIPSERFIAEDNHATRFALKLVPIFPPSSSNLSALEIILRKSMDNYHAGQVLPGLVAMLEVLSEDELYLLKLLAVGPLEYADKSDLVNKEFINRVVLEDPNPEKGYKYPDLYQLTILHLLSLNLIEFPMYDQIPIFDEKKVQIGLTTYSRLQLSYMGHKFIKLITAHED